MLSYLGALINALVIPMGNMGGALTLNVANFGAQGGGTYAAMPMSTASFTVFALPWINGLGPITTALATFLGSVSGWLTGLHAFLTTF